MTKTALVLSFAAALLASAPALATEYDCEGIFARDTTLAAIEAEFGTENVTSGEVPGPEGEVYTATTIYPGDPQREMQVRWWDEANLSGFAGVTLAAADTGPFGVKVGMPIGEVEEINDMPFDLWGFFWDYGGGAYFERGVLSELAGGCSLNVQFAPALQELPEALATAISGEVTLHSNQPELREAQVEVWRVDLNYPYPQPSLAELTLADITELIDVTSFRNSIEPRREDGLMTFADYGFTEFEVADDGVELYEADRSWMFSIRLLEAGEERLLLCVADKALGGPSYDAQSAIAFERGEGDLLVAVDEDVQDPDCPARP